MKVTIQCFFPHQSNTLGVQGLHQYYIIPNALSRRCTRSGRLVPHESLIVFTPRFDTQQKAKRRFDVFPFDCQKAFEMGMRFAKASAVSQTSSLVLQRAAQALVADRRNSAASNGITVSFALILLPAYQCDKKLGYNCLTPWEAI